MVLSVVCSEPHDFPVHRRSMVATLRNHHHCLLAYVDYNVLFHVHLSTKAGLYGFFVIRT